MKMKLAEISLIICLVISILIFFMKIDSLMRFEIEEKTVWITSDIIKNHTPKGGNTYFVRYDDYKGEIGIITTNSKGNGLKKGDSVTVYRNINGKSESDSTHGWKLSVENIKNENILSIILSSIGIVIFTVMLLKRYKNDNKEKINS